MSENMFNLGIRRTLFNKNLKSAILNSGLTYKQIGEKLKVSMQTLSKYMNFHSNPSEQMRINLAILLNTQIDTIFPEKYDEIYAMISPAKRLAEIEITPMSLSNPDFLQLASGENIESKVNDKLFYDNALSVLSDKEKLVVELRSNGETLDDVGKVIGVTIERVRQIESKAYEKIRQSRFVKHYKPPHTIKRITRVIKKEMKKCKICEKYVPENRSETCSPKCYEIYSKGMFQALAKLSKQLPRVKLHF